MSLVNPTVGEITDRLTILALKRLHGSADGKDVAHFDREWAALHTMIRARTLNGAWFESVLELGAVNAELWARTDIIRQWEKQATTWSTVDSTGLGGKDSQAFKNILTEAGACGLQILRLNDRRATLVQQINQLCGEHEGPEKL